MRRATGFTLLEALIAGLIIFSALSLSALALKTARSSSLVAEKTVLLRVPQPLLLSHIRGLLNGSSGDVIKGEGLLSGVHFQFTATPIAKGTAPASFDPETGVPRPNPERFRLYQIELQVSLGPRTEVFTYKEFAVANVI